MPKCAPPWSDSGCRGHEQLNLAFFLIPRPSPATLGPSPPPRPLSGASLWWEPRAQQATRVLGQGVRPALGP